MMRTLLLLAFAVLTSSAPVHNNANSSAKGHSDRKLLGELVDELEKTVKIFSKETGDKSVFVTELQTNGCKREVFCQAEQELKTKVSGRSGAKFDHFRTDKKLMRNLNIYNKHHGKTCKPDVEVQTEMPLHEFLPMLLTCVKNEFSQAK
ncbi:interleukin-13 [Onychostoma macrolepis]|uniref:Interleukin 4/13A n=1 Tax=Onychostoma macrolepis TaxID=369639 RepID=A0A7J6BTE1_9TELE|nr:interleukin-13 [Onychostoma macrolepis]KAF4098236.1 hypothetical protein G5714_020266 [Onychostoma macrolepis]